MLEVATIKNFLKTAFEAVCDNKLEAAAIAVGVIAAAASYALPLHAEFSVAGLVPIGLTGVTGTTLGVLASLLSPVDAILPKGKWDEAYFKTVLRESKKIMPASIGLGLASPWFGAAVLAGAAGYYGTPVVAGAVQGLAKICKSGLNFVR